MLAEASWSSSSDETQKMRDIWDAAVTVVAAGGVRRTSYPHVSPPSQFAWQTVA
jgi:hypothetical protein